MMRELVIVSERREEDVADEGYRRKRERGLRWARRKYLNLMSGR